MNINLIGPFVVNAPFGTEIAFSKGLKKNGHTTNEVDPNIDRDLTYLRSDFDVTVVFKSCCGSEKYLKSLKHPVIVYQPDDARFSHIREMIINMKNYSSYFLSFDNFGTEFANVVGYLKSKTLLLTADDELYSPSINDIERDIDISFIGSLSDSTAHKSRREMIDIVNEFANYNNLKTFFGSTQNTRQVVDIYRRSKIVLNHATDVGQDFGYGYGLQCRHFEVGMTKTAILSNTVYDKKFNLDFATFNSKQDLIEKIDYLLSYDVYKYHAENYYKQIMSFHTPEIRAAQLVKFIEECK